MTCLAKEFCEIMCENWCEIIWKWSELSEVVIKILKLLNLGIYKWWYLPVSDTYMHSDLP